MIAWTRSSSRWLLAPLSLLVSLAAPASAAPSRKLDPKIARVIATGIVGGTHRGPRRPGTAKVVVELERPAGLAELDALTTAGARLTLHRGRALYWKRYVPAIVDSVAAERIAALPGVVRVHAVGPRGPLPLDRSATLVHLAEARSARPMIDELTGTGTLIADIDSAVDPFHPAFFKGDGGWFEWIDVDKDGVFTPGTDAIDLDRDGLVGNGEVAHALRAVTVGEDDKEVMARTPGWDPGLDWLFLDINGSGQREYGAQNGFDDTVPAFGEPLFTPDDVNKNGKLDPGERVVRLSTSKFRAIFIDIQIPNSFTQQFDRGSNLSATEFDFSMGRAFGFADSLHATGVSTILVGDLPLVGRKWVGMAPDAELITNWDEGTSALPVDGTMWALGMSPDVVLYEMAPWTGNPLDGSDMLSQIIDESTTTDHVTHTCPTGDQGSARKHGALSVATGADGSMIWNLPATAPFRTDPLTYVELSIHVRGGLATTLTLKGPKGESYDLLGADNGPLASGAHYYISRETTPRNTYFVDVILYSMGPTTPLDVGDWTLSLHANSALTVDGYVSDDQSSWALGAAWDPSVATDRATLGIPSVADHCIAVNAQPDHLETKDTPWFTFYYELYDVPPGYTDKDLAIRAYSPRGPRLDGVMKPDVTAPDNPWVATHHDTESRSPYGAYRVFGGTSGASPHVTGVAALLAQAGVHGDAARDAIRNGAQHDAVTGAVPNGDYGWGRLDAAGALGVTLTGKDFTVAVTPSPPEPHLGDDIKLVATAQGDADATTGLNAKWDEGYDGSWDTPYAASLEHPITPAMPGRYVYKVRVRNGGGHVAEAIAVVTVGEHEGCSCRIGGATALPPIGQLALLLALAWWSRVRTRRT